MKTIGRPKKYVDDMTTTTSITIPRKFLAAVDQAAKTQECNRSSLVVAALAAHLGANVRYASKSGSLPSGAITR